MRFVCFFLILFGFTQACTTKAVRDYTPGNYLSDSEQTEVKHKIIRYLAKAPRRVVVDSLKLDTAFNQHYIRQTANHNFIAYYISDKKEHFFLISRIAPSLEEKWVATGGVMRFDDNQNLVEYEEIFRTWKLPKSLMEERSKYLFDLMVKNEDLSPYYTKTSGFNYIEFPDEHVSFDKKSRSWKSKKFGSVEEMVYENRDLDSLSKK